MVWGLGDLEFLACFGGDLDGTLKDDKLALDPSNLDRRSPMFPVAGSDSFDVLFQLLGLSADASATGVCNAAARVAATMEGERARSPETTGTPRDAAAPAFRENEARDACEAVLLPVPCGWSWGCGVAVCLAAANAPLFPLYVLFAGFGLTGGFAKAVEAPTRAALRVLWGMGASGWFADAEGIRA